MSKITDKILFHTANLLMYWLVLCIIIRRYIVKKSCILFGLFNTTLVL